MDLPSKPGLPPQQPGKKSFSGLDAFRPKPAQEEEFLFFNVMPKVANSGENLVQPTLKVIESQEKKPAGSLSVAELFKKHRLYFVIGIVVAIFGVAGYFVYGMLTKVNEEDLIVSGNDLKPAGDQVKPAEKTTANMTLEEWQEHYFGAKVCAEPNMCGDGADPERDGLNNKEEFGLKSDPNNSDSDQDGLSDGDEVKIFGSDPLKTHSGSDTNYSDSDYAKGGYDLKTGQKYTEAETIALSNKMKQFGVHPPTTQTLQDALVNLYKFTDWNAVPVPPEPPTATGTPLNTGPAATSSPLSGFDTSVSAQQDRDAQRSATIQNIGMALIKYYADTKTYPKTAKFAEMHATIKPYLKVATRPEDPVNKEPYVYSYQPSADGKDYTLSFYSEVAGQIIKKHASDAQKAMDEQQASIFDDQRKTHLQMLQTALLLYSNKNASGNQDYVFPTESKYKADLMPNYITQIPKDPKTGADYEYEVSETFDTFTLKAVLDNPSTGTTGYLCNQEECRNY